VGVVDKSVTILDALELGPQSLSDLVAATGISRPTAHRLASALEHHRLVGRDSDGRFVLGSRLAELAAATRADELAVLARPVLLDLRDATGESTQLYRRRADARVCIATADLAHGLRDTVPIGAVLTMTAGSAAQVLLAWQPDADRSARSAAFSAQTLATVRRRGWAESIGEREPGVASVSAPVRAAGGRVLAAVSLSGPIERLGRSPGRRHADRVVRAGESLSQLLAARAG
jgi:DNA-binding IclR family transcriptional regulator